MPKPVKKSTKTREKSTTPKRPSADPMLRARQLQAEHLASVDAATPPWKAQGETVTPPHGDTFEAQLSAHMAKLGAKGGKASGAKRLQMPVKLRKAIARKGGLAKAAKNRPEQS